VNAMESCSGMETLVRGWKFWVFGKKVGKRWIFGGKFFGKKPLKIGFFGVLGKKVEKKGFFGVQKKFLSKIPKKGVLFLEKNY
jgi:hypothetical protein